MIKTVLRQTIDKTQIKTGYTSGIADDLIDHFLVIVNSGSVTTKGLLSYSARCSNQFLQSLHIGLLTPMG
jgi:hypothetical protein